MAKRYIIQKREIEERHGKKPNLMGPYRTVYSDTKPPFDVTDKEKTEAHLLKAYGEGRYQVKSVGAAEGETQSKITIHYSGDIEKYRPHAKVWTKEERIEHTHAKWRTSKEKIFAMVAFFVVFLVMVWLFFASLGSGLDSSVAAVVIFGIVIVFILAAFFIDMMLFETE